MTDIIEIISLRRSGHHAIMAWLTHNLTGLKINSWDYRLTVMGDSNFLILNEGNEWQVNAGELLNNFGSKPKTLMVNYEDVRSYYSVFGPNNYYYGKMNLKPFWGIEPKDSYRFLVIRDFYNLISSRYHANITKHHSHTYDKIFIDTWKEHARAVIENRVSYIKFEDWLTSKDKRNSFLKENFLINETINIEKIKGTGSSFKESNNVLNRYDMVELPDNVKKMIKNDDELNYLIGAVGYKYKKL